MEWFLGLFILTGWAIWIVATVFFFIILAFAENEKNFFAAVSLLIFAAIMHHSNFLVFPHPWVMAKYFGYYFLLGAGWSIMKWYFYIAEKANIFKVNKIKFIKQINNIQKGSANYTIMKPSYKTEIPVDLINRFKVFLVEEMSTSYYHQSRVDAEQTIADIVIPAAADNKETITTWILWWPTSAFWTILNDPLVKFANAIYDRFQGIYTRISNMVFKDMGLD